MADEEYLFESQINWRCSGCTAFAMDGTQHDPERRPGHLTEKMEKDKVEEGEVDNSHIDNDNSNTVTWDSETDPSNPMNWTLRKKWGHVGIVAVITFIA